MKGQVFIEQEDGQLKPVELPADIAARAALYKELRAQNLDLEEIKFIWTIQVPTERR